MKTVHSRGTATRGRRGWIGRMSLAVIATGTVAAGALWSCAMTRTANGEITLTFAPDMVIHAVGLEDCLHQLTNMLGSCLDGTFPRPCTTEQVDDITKALEKVIDAKKDLEHGPSSQGSHGASGS